MTARFGILCHRRVLTYLPAVAMQEKSRLDVLERRWREILEQGQTIAPDEFCAEEGCPELANELKSIIENQTIIEGKAPAPAQVGTLHNTKAETEESARRAASNFSAQETLDIPSAVRNGPAPSFEDSDAVQHGTQSRYGRMQFVAEGGLGQVFRATDSSLNRDVALKFIRPEHADNDELHQRFLAETEITAQLEHPGVVPLYGFGRTFDGRIFYAMRFIQGETLNDAIERFHEPKTPDGAKSPTRKLKAEDVEFRRLLGRLVSVCYTIDYAHNRGVIHRDLKPQNIMLGKFDETLVVDWGLAMRVGRPIDSREVSVHLPSSSGSGSNSGSSAGGSGTPAYMSPEQADPDNKSVDQASDIFSLGAILYKILTGEPPFQGRTQREVMGRARANEFGKPSAAIKGVPKALEAICLKTMSLAPSDRYPRARDLAADLERYLSDAPVTACKDPWYETLRRWTWRHRGGTFTIAGLVATVAIFGILLSVVQARQQAETARLHENSLRASASFAARGIAEEIENRWLILKKAALDPSLPDLIASASAGKKVVDDQEGFKEVPDEPRKKLDIFMTHLWKKMKDKTQAATLFMLDNEGFVIGQKARDDDSLARIIGKDLSGRDYYDDPKTIDHEITRRPLRSSLYKSKRDNRQKIAFTVPIFTGRRDEEKVVGLLGMSVDPGDFKFLSEQLPQGQIAVLVDMRKDTADRTGRIVQYGSSDDTVVARLAEESFYMGESELKQLELRQRSTAAKPLPSLTRTHHCPLGGNAPMLAAYEPVIVENHLCDLDDEEPLIDTGLMVIIQESP